MRETQEAGKRVSERGVAKEELRLQEWNMKACSCADVVAPRVPLTLLLTPPFDASYIINFPSTHVSSLPTRDAGN